MCSLPTVVTEEAIDLVSFMSVRYDNFISKRWRRHSIPLRGTAQGRPGVVVSPRVNGRDSECTEADLRKFKQE